jgi:hypothetical protein
MKERNGFVSNSSSSSFILYKKDLTDIQIDQIRNHIQVALANHWDEDSINTGEFDEDGDPITQLGCAYASPSDAWTVSETDTKIELDTHLDNFQMEEFLRLIGVPADKIH